MVNATSALCLVWGTTIMDALFNSTFQLCCCVTDPYNLENGKALSDMKGKQALKKISYHNLNFHLLPFISK